MDKKLMEYCIDESKYTGWAESISFPESLEELKNMLKKMRTEEIPVTIQGGKTGITGAAVPEGGHIVNLSRMNHILDFSFAEDKTAVCRVEPGINLIDLQRELDILSRKEPVFWPVDPTERTATVGGIAAVGAQGICGYLYGECKKYIKQIKMLCWNGEEILIPAEEESRNDVLGAEGASGIITELSLQLLPKPKCIWGITFFFEKREDVSGFVETMKKEQLYSDTAAIAAVEYMNESAVRLIESYKKSMMKIREVPDVGAKYRHLIYLEIHGLEEGIEELTERVMEIAMEYGSDPDEAWAVSGEREIERMHDFRHGAAETANLEIERARQNGEEITKLGCDMSFPDSSFGDILARYEEDLEKAQLRSCIFGHAMDAHLHVNILPDTKEEYTAGMALMRTWAAGWGDERGNIISEHGIGKLKEKIYGEELLKPYLQRRKRIKEKMDPHWMWNREGRRQ